MSVEVCATISQGIVRRGKKEERAPARTWVEAALIVAKDDVAQTATWRFDGQGQVGGQRAPNTMEKWAAGR